MPRGFTEHERAHLHTALLTHGRALFERHGLKRTSVDDIARAAGLSKGGFYLFFASKEALFFTIAEQVEAEFRAEVFDTVREPNESAVSYIRRQLHRALSTWRQKGLFSNLTHEEYAILLRRLPPERVQAHLSTDQSFAAQLCARWSEVGITVRCSPVEFDSLLRALFVLSLHADEFAPDQYAFASDTLLDLVVREMVV